MAGPCHAVFTGGRQYFSNHWHNDPWRDPEGIRIAMDNGAIVSTVRVFIRKMFLHGEPITVGGLGEVSTRPRIPSTWNCYTTSQGFDPVYGSPASIAVCLRCTEANGSIRLRGGRRYRVTMRKQPFAAKKRSRNGMSVQPILRMKPKSMQNCCAL